MSPARLLLFMLCLSSIARAEGVGPPKPAKDGWLFGADTLVPYKGGVVAIGGPSLRRLPNGAKRWETVYSRPGDSLYRLAVDDTGRIAALWEKDSAIRVFTPGVKEPVVLALPNEFPPGVKAAGLEAFTFLENGRDLLIAMGGSRQEGRCSVGEHVVFRVAFDGRSKPQPVLQWSGGSLMRARPSELIYAEGTPPDSNCRRSIGAVASYEFTTDGGKRTTLMTTEKLAHPVETAWVLRQSERDQLGVMLTFAFSKGRVLARFRRGSPSPELVPLPAPPTAMNSHASFITPAGEFIDLQVRDDDYLDIRRRSPEGAETLMTLEALQYVDNGLYGIGVRPNGELWIHWGDHVALLAPGKPPRAFSMEHLLPRRADWAGVDVHVAEPQETLWVGIDGLGRDFARLSFKDVDAAAKPWVAPGP